MIDKWMAKVKAHHAWRFIVVFALAEIIGVLYLIMYLLSILAK